jgi:hypothetical protein
MGTDASGMTAIVPGSFAGSSINDSVTAVPEPSGVLAGLSLATVVAQPPTAS